MSAGLENRADVAEVAEVAGQSRASRTRARSPQHLRLELIAKILPPHMDPAPRLKGKGL